MVLLTTPDDIAANYGNSAERVDAQGEENLVKVTVGNRYYYIGTADRDEYNISEISENDLPDDFVPGKYLYMDGAFSLNPDYQEPSEETL